MTRINCVPVEELSVKHLVAEYRELPRVYGLAAAAFVRGEDFKDHGKSYTLGSGHVRFFYSRMGYIVQRHRQLIAEMLRRGYKPTYQVVIEPENIPKSWYRNWEPDSTALAISRARIVERS